VAPVGAGVLDSRGEQPTADGPTTTTI